MPSLPVNVAVVVQVGPLIDDGDFKTLEKAIAWNESGMSIDLFQKSTASLVKTDMTPTAPGGDNDWTHKGNGVYEFELTAAQNNTKGTLQIVGICDGVLPFESPVYNVVPIQVYNSLDLGTDRLETDACEMSKSETAANILELILQNMVGTDNKLLLSTDAQDLKASLSVNTGALSGVVAAAVNLKDIANNAKGTDNKIKISADVQDLSATLSVKAKLVSDKTGYALSSVGLDSVATTEPAGVASNFREMLVQIWRRFFKLSTLSATELKCMKDDDVTPATTQPVTDTGTLQTQGKAS